MLLRWLCKWKCTYSSTVGSLLCVCKAKSVHKRIKPWVLVRSARKRATFGANFRCLPFLDHEKPKRQKARLNYVPAKEKERRENINVTRIWGELCEKRGVT